MIITKGDAKSLYDFVRDNVLDFEQRKELAVAKMFDRKEPLYMVDGSLFDDISELIDEWCLSYEFKHRTSIDEEDFVCGGLLRLYYNINNQNL